MCSKGFLNIQLFHRYFEKILPKHSRVLTERITPFSDLFFCEIVIIFLGRNTPNNMFLDVKNKETKKVMWHRCWSPSIMNIEQLIFTWKGRHLVLALFASIFIHDHLSVVAFEGCNCFFSLTYWKQENPAEEIWTYSNSPVKKVRTA